MHAPKRKDHKKARSPRPRGSDSDHARIIVHMGMGKCGSTTLQNFLVGNEDVLRASSVDYPKIGRARRGTQHQNIVHDLLEQRRGPVDPRVGTLPDLVQHWIAEGAKITVLSSEIFSYSVTDEIVRLRNAFLAQPRSPEFTILMVIRNLSDFIRSGYVKRIRYGDNTYDFDEYFSRVFVNSRITDFFGIGSTWADIFGWSRMEIRVLDPRYLVNGDLVEDFVELLQSGIPFTGTGMKCAPRNVSPGWKTAEALRALYRGAPIVLSDSHPLVSAAANPALRKAIGDAAKKAGDKRGWNDNKGCYLTREQDDFCLEKYSAAIQSFNKFLPRHLPFPEHGGTSRLRERTKAPAADMIPKEELEDFYEATWRRVSRRAPGRTGIVAREPRDSSCASF